MPIFYNQEEGTLIGLKEDAILQDKQKIITETIQNWWQKLWNAWLNR